VAPSVIARQSAENPGLEHIEYHLPVMLRKKQIQFFNKKAITEIGWARPG
jgi:hypothetical protein